MSLQHTERFEKRRKITRIIYLRSYEVRSTWRNVDLNSEILSAEQLWTVVIVIFPDNFSPLQISLENTELESNLDDADR